MSDSQSKLLEIQSQYEKILAKIGENHLSIRALRKQTKALIIAKDDLNKQYQDLKAEPSNGTN